MWEKAGIAAVLIFITLAGSAAAIEADTNIRLDPHPTHISFYNNSTYISCNFTNQEAANVTIKFERYNTSTNATDLMHDFGEFAINQTSEFNITTANYSAVGRYRAVMYAIDGSELCAYWIAVRSNTSSNYEKLYGSSRFSDADSVPTVSFIEPISGRGQTWTTDSISLTHSLELYVFDSGLTAATGTLTFIGNTSDGETINISTDRYEFDTNSSVASGNIAVDVSGGNNNSSRSCELFAAKVTADDTVGVGASCAGSVVTLTADTIGTAGNSIATTETCANASFGAATLAGGGGGTEWTPAAGGNCSLVSYTNTSGDLTNWVLSQTYTLGRHYMMMIYSHDYELLDLQIVKAVIPTSNVVEIIVKDAETSEQIMTYTATMTDIEKTASGGKVIWTNVTNGEHLITVTADGYATGTTKIYMANSFINTTVYLLRSSPYYTPHWVRFVLCNVVGSRYSDVNVTVAYTSANGEAITLSEITGTDGAAVFLLTPTIQHTITFTNATQGISKSVVLYPKDTEYYIVIGETTPWSDYEHIRYDEIHVAFASRIINDTHAYINCTYRDDLNGTTALIAFINQSNASGSHTQIMVASHTFAGDLNDTNHSFIVSPYKGEAYICRVWHEHTEFHSWYDHIVQFWGMKVDLGLPAGCYIYISMILIIFVGAFFGATTAETGSVIICALGWVFLSFGWLHELGIFAPISISAASVYAVVTVLNERNKKSGYA